MLRYVKQIFSAMVTGHGIGIDLPMPLIEGIVLLASFAWVFLWAQPWQDESL